jgi:protein involved in polysaccharide export with SLBB domain
VSRPTTRGFSGRAVSLLVLTAVAAGGGCGVAGHTTPEVRPEDAPTDTTIGPGDVFDVRVYGEEGLTGTYRVASDGTVDYPLLGTISVQGMTPTEVTRRISDGLVSGQFLKNPNVSVFVKEYSSKKISIFGQVNKPGTFQYVDGMSIVEAISIAGGFTSMARPNDVAVTRVINSVEKKFLVPVEAIGQGRASNFVLRPGDIVFVPQRVF